MILQSSVADPERFDANPDPTFQADADPDPASDPNPFTRVRNVFLQISNYCFQSLPKPFLSFSNFLFDFNKNDYNTVQYYKC